MDQKNDQIILGIDFGSSNSCISYYCMSTQELETLTINTTKKTIPSTICITPENQILIGLQAKEKVGEKNCFYHDNLKRQLLEKNQLIYQGKKLNIQLLISQILLYLKRQAQLKLNVLVSKCVLTVPAYFSEETRHILKDSAIIAGLKPIRVINEPTAAAIYYSNIMDQTNKTCLFIDAGGLTLDMTVCNILSGIIDIISTHGDHSCGHYLVNQQIEKQVIQQIKNQDPYFDTQQHEVKLKQMVQEIKVNYFDLNVPNFKFTFKFNQKKTYNVVLNRSQLYNFYVPYIQRLKKVYYQLINKTEFTSYTIEKIVLIGGPMNSNFFRTLVLHELGYEKAQYFDNITSVSKGAALYGAFLQGQSCSRLLTDVLPISIGVETSQGLFEKLIPSNTKLPCIKVSQFTTAQDFQSKVKIRLFEGQRPITKNCNFLGQIELDKIEVGLRGAPSIMIMLQVTPQGLINAYVEDAMTKSNKNLQINSRSRLKPYEMERLVLEAKKYNRSDEKFINLMRINSKIKKLRKNLQELIGLSPSQDQKNKALLKESEHTITYEYKNEDRLKQLYHDMVNWFNSLKKDLNMIDCEINKK